MEVSPILSRATQLIEGTLSLEYLLWAQYLTDSLGEYSLLQWSLSGALVL